MQTKQYKLFFLSNKNTQAHQRTHHAATLSARIIGGNTVSVSVIGTVVGAPATHRAARVWVTERVVAR